MLIKEQIPALPALPALPARQARLAGEAGCEAGLGPRSVGAGCRASTNNKYLNGVGVHFVIETPHVRIAVRLSMFSKYVMQAESLEHQRKDIIARKFTRLKAWDKKMYQAFSLNILLHLC